MDRDKFLDIGCANPLVYEELYDKWRRDPQSVEASWRSYFNSLDQQPSQSTSPPPILEKEVSVVFQPRKEAAAGPPDVRVYNLIQAYRQFGHLMANVNPIALHPPQEPRELQLETYGLSKQDLSRPFPTFGLLKEPMAPLLKIINDLKSIYCNKIGVEYIETHSLELESWLQRQIEPTHFKAPLTIEQKQMILQQLNKSELLESFLHTKYVGQKRFSIEGGETLIPMLSSLLDTAANFGAEEFVIGMAHRGRLNVLSNIMNKSYVDIFTEFDESYIPESIEGSGDVKYHKGYNAEVETASKKKVKIDLSPNPSHLEAVDPVVEGMVRAKQTILNDEESHKKVVPILIHGDAAIAGQGVVYETLQMYKLEGYSTGGTIHIVINNQIGFTTLPKDSRSTLYDTDIAKGFSCPVFHVNAEDPDGCVYVTNLAVEMRQKFHCDVFIDLCCYRKYGHNESDEPAFTQPIEYQLIRKKKPIRDLYRDELIQQGVLEKYMAEALETEFKNALNVALKSIKTFETKEPKEEKEPVHKFNGKPTGVAKEEIEEVATRFCTIPEGFHIHPKLEHFVIEHLAMVQEPKPIDWGMAETLAYATLLIEGTPVRISGQDSCRGTFSHRHAVWMDQIQEKTYFPLKHLSETQARFDIYNSPLSEYAVLGFEYGYSTSYPESLVIWEAQFGDFSNGAQVVIDQFVSPSEQKWGQRSGLVMFLPHGYEGQGPEHSSARIERYLSLCGHDNMQVVNPTTPAQFFHLLRRQMVEKILKPLIVFTPKGLLRHPACVSNLNEFVQGSFKEILDDPKDPKNIKKVVLCSGRIYYDLDAMRTKNNAKDLAIVRIEELYPLHTEQLKEILEKYEGYKECIWVQEEPSNMGAWEYMRPLLREILPKGKEARYIGRHRSASTAVGSHALHKKESAAIMHELFQPYELRIPENQSGIKS